MVLIIGINGMLGRSVQSIFLFYKLPFLGIDKQGTPSKYVEITDVLKPTFF